MKKWILFPTLVCSVFGYSQNFIQAYQDRANLVSQTTINTYLQQFEDLGVKRTGTAQNTATLNWIKAKYEGLGFSSDQISVHNWTSGQYTSANLIVTKTGTLYPNKYVIVCGHFDSINGPGVNDNGSGTSIIMEIARILKDVPTEYSIKFIHFSGEEQGLLGSSRYVSQVVNGTSPKMDIKVVVNIDQVGGIRGGASNKVYCDQDQSNPVSNNAAGAQAVQELATCTSLYSPLSTAITRAENTDYMPFQSNGEVITGYWEYEGGYNNPHVHKATDKVENMDPVYVYNLAKGATGAIQHFAVATSTLGLSDQSVSGLKNIEIYPNPAKSSLQLKIDDKLKNVTVQFSDPSGKQLNIKKSALHSYDVSALSPGIYFVTISADKESVTKKFIIEK